MTTFRLAFLITTLLAGSAVHSQSVKDIVANYKKALQKSADEHLLKTGYFKGQFTFNKKMTLPIEIFFKMPREMRLQMHFQGASFIQIANDSLTWDYNGLTGESKLTRRDADDGPKQQNDNFDFAQYDLLNYKERKINVKLIGMEQLDSLQVYVLELDTDQKTRVFINKKDFLVVKTEDRKGKRQFGKYINVDGFVMPAYYHEVKGDEDLTGYFDEVKFNQKFADSLFVIPQSAFDEDNKLRQRSNDQFGLPDSLYNTGDYKASIEKYTAIISSQPGSRAYNARGLAKIAVGEYYSAISDFTRAIELEPNSGTIWNNLGLAKFRLGDNEGAIRDYDKAIELKPTLAIAYQNRGVAYFHQQKYAEAKKDFLEVLKFGEAGETYFNLGVSQAQLKEYGAALKSYQKALSLQYENASIYNYKGVTEFQLERYDTASQSFAKAISLDGNEVQYLENYGRALYELGDYEGAVTQFEKYARKQSDNAEIYNLIGLCKYRIENYKGAIQDFTKAIKLDENQAVYFDNRASAKERVEDYEGAIKDYGESIRIYPNDGSVFYKRGLIKLKTSKKLEGCSDLGTAHEMKYEAAKEAILQNCN